MSLQDFFNGAAVAVITAAVLPHAYERITNGVYARFSGMGQAFNNASTIINRNHVREMVEESFENNAKIGHVFIELANMAVIAKKGEEPIILDFTRSKDEMQPAVLYTMMKEKLGKENPEDIYQFVKAGLPFSLEDLQWNNVDGMDSIESERIYEHAKMKCSWARRLMNNIKGRGLVTEAAESMLKRLAKKQGKYTNISEKGVIALRVKGEGDSQAIIIKPYTDTEKPFFTRLFETRRVNEDKNGNKVTGDEAIKNYAKVKEAMVADDRTYIEAKRILRQQQYSHPYKYL